MQEQKMQYLQFIQNIITRHNTNSFQIKKLTIAIITAIFGVYAAKGISCPQLILISSMTTFFLWLLDAKYLKQERQFRMLYNDAVSYKVKVYSMDISPYDVNYKGILFSKTMRIFYIPLIFLTVAIAVCVYLKII
jgi:hypothetical protein